MWDKERLKTRKPIKKIKPQEETEKQEDAPSESTPMPPPLASKPTLSAIQKELMSSISMAYLETNARIGEMPDKVSAINSNHGSSTSGTDSPFSHPVSV